MDTIANDFTINIATANGTGSQSANLIASWIDIVDQSQSSRAESELTCLDGYIPK